METGISVNKFIYQILINDLDLKKTVHNNIFPLIAEEGATFPFIIYKRGNVNTEYTKDQRLCDKVNVNIMIVSNKYIDSVDIAEKVRQLVENKKTDKLIETRLTEVNEDFIDDSYVQELTFSTIIK